MSKPAATISEHDFQAGPLVELSRRLPEIGAGTGQVVLRKQRALTPRMLAGVTDLIALAPFSCRGPVRDVRALYLGHDAVIDESTARSFVGLERLRVASRSPVDMSWFDSVDLTHLSVSDRSVQNLDSVRHRTIANVALFWTGRSLEFLPESAKSVTLAAMCRAPVKAIAPIWKLPDLEELILRNVPLRSLRQAAGASRLRSLSAPLRSLEGAAALEHLRELRVDSDRQCPPVASLASLPHLVSLHIRADSMPDDPEQIGRINRLRRLVLDLGYMGNIPEITSLDFLAHLDELRELVIMKVRLSSKDVTPIQELPRLRRLKLVGEFGPGLKALVDKRKRRKGVVTDVHVVELSDEPPSLCEPRRIGGIWSIFEDLTAPLRVKTNYRAEELIVSALKKAAPKVLPRIEFDTEAGAFSASANAREDIDILARLIRAMAGRLPPGQTGASPVGPSAR